MRAAVEAAAADAADGAPYTAANLKVGVRPQ